MFLNSRFNPNYAMCHDDLRESVCSLCQLCLPDMLTHRSLWEACVRSAPSGALIQQHWGGGQSRPLGGQKSQGLEGGSVLVSAFFPTVASCRSLQGSCSKVSVTVQGNVGQLQLLGPNKKVPSLGPLVGPLRESKTHISQAPTSGWCIEGATWGARQDPGLCCLCTDKETQLDLNDLAAMSATY